MTSEYQELANLLDELETELKALSWWEPSMPSYQALSSTQPFCHDTLSFHQWLQWRFLPQMRQLIAQSAPLPDSCSITPMAELSYQDNIAQVEALLEILSAIDHTITSRSARLS